MNINDELLACIENNGLKNPSLIVNGKQLMHSGRRVYLEVDKRAKNCVNFFTRIYDKQQKTSTMEYLNNQINYIRYQMRSDMLFDVLFPIKSQWLAPTISVDAVNNIIFVNSALYEAGQALQQKDSSVKTFFLGDDFVGEEQTTLLRKLFLQKSLENYADIIYTTSVNRFVKSLVRSNKFYGIVPYSFVPVFIQFNGLTDPLTSKELGITDTLMYRTAQQKGRFVQTSTTSAYFLTHKEICECFGMSRFVRFTPHVWYNLFVGLLQPSNTAFPNKISKVIKWDAEDAPPANFKRVYNQDEFAALMNSNPDLSQEELATYKVVDTLEEFIERELATIKNIGPYYMDDRSKLTKGTFYDIFSEATLRY